MKGRDQNRRTFLKQSGVGALGLTILPWSTTAVAPSDTLRVAHIGEEEWATTISIGLPICLR